MMMNLAMMKKALQRHGELAAKNFCLMQNKRVVLLSLLSTIAGSVFAQSATPINEKEAHREFRVRYVTADAIYFNGGTALGVQIGDLVWVMRNGERVLPLQVKYVAEHSASCLLEAETRPQSEVAARLLPVRVDDTVLWTIPLAEFQKRMRPAQAEAKTQSLAAAPRKISRTAPVAPKRYVEARSRNNAINGQMSLQSFGQKDRSPQPFDFLESSAYLRLTMDRIGGAPVRLVTRMRSSQSFRPTSASGLQQQPLLHRVYEITLEYSGPLELAIGRMLRNELRGVGYLDGLVVGYRVHPNWKLGVFAGAQPDLYRAGLRFEEKKYGGFLQMEKTLRANSNVAFMAAALGQYQRQHLNREYLAAQIDFTWSRQFFLTQYVELDLNRDWRRELSASRVAISNAYFSASYYPAAQFSCGLSF
ncbi:MAG: hypothetical protein AAB354_02750, partial [candidate division KSB1 bacterium]